MGLTLVLKIDTNIVYIKLVYISRLTNITSIAPYNIKPILLNISFPKVVSLLTSYITLILLLMIINTFPFPREAEA